MTSPYFQSPQSKGASPYFSTPRSSGNSPYFGGGGKAAPAKKGGKGFFGRLLGDVESIGLNAPAGIYHVGRAIGHDISGYLLHGYDPNYHAGSRTYRQVIRPMAKSIINDISHPLRHPGYTGLDILALASLGAGTGAKVAATERALQTGEDVAAVSRATRLGRVAEAAVRGPKPGTIRMVGKSGTVAERPASRAAFSRLAQQELNKLRNRFPNAPIFGTTQSYRVGRINDRLRQQELARATAEGERLRGAGVNRRAPWRSITANSPRGMAMRAFIEETPLETIQQTFRRSLANLKPGKDEAYARKNLGKQIDIAERAKKFLREENGVLKLTEPKLEKLAWRSVAASLGEDARIIERAAPKNRAALQATLRAAISKPGRIYRGATFIEEVPTAAAKEAGALEAAGQSAFPGIEGSRLEQGLVGAENFTGGKAHIGYQYRNPRGLGRLAMGSGDVMNARRALPARLTHPLMGKGTIMVGRIRHDIPNIIANNVLESERAGLLAEHAQRFFDQAAETPAGLRNPVAIKSPELFRKTLPTPVRDTLDAYKRGEVLNQVQTGLLGMAHDTLRSELFPEDLQALAKYGPIAGDARWEGVRFIQGSELGGLNKAPLLLGWEADAAGRILLSINDAVNNASKFAILYLKPAYVVPNVVGNAFLALTQQGWLTPREIQRSMTLHRAIGAEDTFLIDTTVGEQGISRALIGQGPVSGLTNIGAAGWSKVVDLPFRRSAFLYEARRLGYTSAAQIKNLLHDAAHAQDLQEVTQRANRALIDYGDLNPFERSVIRRVIFFYPWLKGAARWSGEYVRDHPLQAALLANTAELGRVDIAATLGPEPTYAQGMFQVGMRGGFPLALQPSSAGILSQPVQNLQQLAGFLGGNVGQGQALAGSLSPFLGASLTALAGRDAFGRDVHPTVGTFLNQLGGGLPQVSLYHRFTQPQAGHTFPYTHHDALLQFLFGGLAPRPVNVGKLRAQAGKKPL